jgi:hypothetical protein
MPLRLPTTVAALFAATAIATAQQAGPSTAPFGRARVPAPTMTTASIVPARTPVRMLPGTRGNVLTTIQGNALDSANGSLRDSLVRLRDARFGRIVDTQLTDKSGLFAFRALDPGSYIIEILGQDQSILAASQMLSVNAGEAVSAVVKLPFRFQPLSGVIGQTVGQAATVTSAAAASGVLATEIAGAPVSPRQ